MADIEGNPLPEESGEVRDVNSINLLSEILVELKLINIQLAEHSGDVLTKEDLT